MANKSVVLTEDNFYEWLCSTGHLLPRNERELARFEQLFPSGSIQVNDKAIDPYGIISGVSNDDQLSITKVSSGLGEFNELRLAARKYDGLPPEILKKIKRNQQNTEDDSSNQPKNSD
jgi:hypothetical protein